MLQLRSAVFVLTGVVAAPRSSWGEGIFQPRKTVYWNWLHQKDAERHEPLYRVYSERPDSKKRATNQQEQCSWGSDNTRPYSVENPDWTTDIRDRGRLFLASLWKLSVVWSSENKACLRWTWSKIRTSLIDWCRRTERRFRNGKEASVSLYIFTVAGKLPWNNIAWSMTSKMLSFIWYLRNSLLGVSLSIRDEKVGF